MKVFRKTLLSFLAVAVCSSLAICTRSVPAQDGDLKQRVLHEYPAALKELHGRLSQCRGSGIEIEVTQGLPPAASTRRHAISFEFSGELLRVSKQPAPGVETAGETEVSISVANSAYAFRASGPTGDGPFALKSFSRRGEKSKLVASLEEFRQDYIYAPFVAITAIDEFLFEPGTKITNVSRENAGKEELVKISYTRGYSFNGVPQLMDCWLLVAPNDRWALRKQEACVKGSCRTSEVEYGDPVGGTPLPRRVTIKTQRTTRTFEFGELALGSPDERDFTLSSVGLPELSPPARPGSGWASFCA